MLDFYLVDFLVLGLLAFRRRRSNFDDVCKMILKTLVFVKFGKDWVCQGSPRIYDNQPFFRLFGKFPETTSRFELRVHDQDPGANAIRIHRAMKKEGCSDSFMFYKPDEKGKCFQGVLSGSIAVGLGDNSYWITGHLTNG